MKIIIVGATGTIGQAVVSALEERHDIISVGHSQGDYQVDIADTKQIEKLYNAIGSFDALISTTGSVHFTELQQFSAEDLALGINNKLMGQVNLVLKGLKHINAKGSFTLVSGLLNQDPILYSASAGMVNGGIEGFVKCAAIEMPKETRINVVSPTVVTESLDKYAAYFRGYKPVPAAEVAQAFVKSVEGRQTGQVYRAGW